jgi:hypothetical protein
MRQQQGPQAFHNFVDDYRGFVQQPNMYNATGDNAAVKPSLPYSVMVSSASAAAVSNFDVFGASTYLNNAQVTFNANGDLVIGSITISSTTPNITYRDLLQQSAWQPFTVGQTYIQCSSPTAQILVPYTITTKDASGVQQIFPGKPKKDPYQQQNDLLIDPMVWSIDGLSKITFNQILPFAVLNLDFYPQSNINIGRSLNGQNPGKDYGNPGIIRSNTAVIPTGGASNFAGGGGQGGVLIKTRY